MEDYLDILEFVEKLFEPKKNIKLFEIRNADRKDYS